MRTYIIHWMTLWKLLDVATKRRYPFMKELDTDAGIGLIEKKRQGQGKPTMIYLKQFVIQDFQKCKNYTSDEKTAISEVKNLHVLKCKNKTVVVASNEYPAELVRSKFLKLTSAHVQYAPVCREWKIKDRKTMVLKLIVIMSIAM